MKSEIAHTARGPIEHTMRGDGPAVLVCHGTSSDCFSAEVGRPLVEAGFRVITPSRPGYGRTPLTVGRTAAESAEALIKLLDTLGIARCEVVATSGGGPTGLALAAGRPERVGRLVLAEAISHPEDRRNEPSYKSQLAFYGPLHPVLWGMLGLLSRLSPDSMARQTLVTFSTHDPDDAMRRLSPDDVRAISRFYRGRSSRAGALNDLTHSVGVSVLSAISQRTLIVHSREDRAVPFSHAEWSLEHIPRAELCEAGFTGHFFWIGPDYDSIKKRMAAFLREPIGPAQSG